MDKLKHKSCIMKNCTNIQRDFENSPYRITIPHEIEKIIQIKKKTF